MHAHGKKVIDIELNKMRYQEIKNKGINVIQGNGLKRNTYQQLEIKPENYIVIETGDILLVFGTQTAFEDTRYKLG